MKPQEYLAKLNEGAELVLPSGLEVRVKPTTSEVLLAKSYPGDLMKLIHEHIFGTGKQKTQQEIEDQILDPQKLIDAQKSTMTWLRVIAENVVIEPVLVDKPADECEGSEFPIRELIWDDLTFLSELVNMPLARLYPFCREQALAMEPVLKGESQFPISVAGNQLAGFPFDAGGEGLALADQDLLNHAPALQPEVAAGALPVVGTADHLIRVVDDLPVR